jgi:signal transduction histidine kinase
MRRTGDALGRSVAICRPPVATAYSIVTSGRCATRVAAGMAHHVGNPAVEDTVTDPGQQPDVDSRVEQLTQGSNLEWVIAMLAQQRDRILARWLALASEQPFHVGQAEGAVSDHIPALYDAVLAFLRRGASRQVETGAPLDDPAVLAAAERHAQSRLQQGLQPVDIVVEFRLLRQEILTCLRTSLPDSVPTSDVLAAELLIHDALDGAVAIGLRVLTELVERVREDFLATTVHDVRQPLGVIQGQTQLLMRRLQRPNPDLARVASDLAQIEAAAKRMGALLATLIDASRIALNHLELKRQRIDLRDLLVEARAQLPAEAAQRLRVELPAGSDVTGDWDEMRLLQVLQNLLSNAVKYAPGATPITVTVADEHDRVLLSVHDQGLGLAAADLPRLFQRYGRATAAVDAHIDGLGLGLYLCRGIIEAHGGRIWATSPGLGHGTTMHIVLPRQSGGVL